MQRIVLVTGKFVAGQVLGSHGGAIEAQQAAAL